MCKRFLLCLASGILFCGNALAAAGLPEIDIKAGCAEIADGSAMIEVQCRKEEAAAKRRLEKMNISRRALRTCSEIATLDGGAGGYVIMEECVKEEMRAEKKLQ
jgi:hypothetical protein